MKRSIILLIAIFTLYVFAGAKELPELEKIKEIKLLESNRADIEKLFKSYKLEKFDELKHYEHFSTKNMNIEVLYSSGKCSEPAELFDVPEWKVVSLRVFAKTRITPADVGLDFTKYRRYGRYGNNSYFNSELGIIWQPVQNRIERGIFTLPVKNSSPLCAAEKARLSPELIGWFFDRRILTRYRVNPTVADVSKLTLSRIKIKASCDALKSAANKNCSAKNKPIKVSAEITYPFDDDLLFNYTVSTGKITGQGKKVLWDLSKAKPGSYTITAAVDDGCGFCGKTITKTVVVE